MQFSFRIRYLQRPGDSRRIVLRGYLRHGRQHGLSRSHANERVHAAPCGHESRKHSQSNRQTLFNAEFIFQRGVNINNYFIGCYSYSLFIISRFKQDCV